MGAATVTVSDPDFVLEVVQCSIGLISEGHLAVAQELLAALYLRVAADAATNCEETK